MPRAPTFWYQPPARLARWLAPLGRIWRFGGWLRARRARPVRVGCPVLCVGNLTVGGAGKTPTVAALVRRLRSRGIDAQVVSRGYGGTRAGPHRVDPRADTADEVGDEPLLLAQTAPVWVARDRAAGAGAAHRAGAELILLDDGFQYPGLVKDRALIVVDAGQGFGNGHVLPAGPLREPVAGGLARADAVILIGEEDDRAAARARWPVLDTALDARLVPVPTGLDLAGEPVIAFAGIGRPAKFYATLRALGARLIATHDFPDHHRY
ncbi:MAG: tetraacyldisaccharide 4'-kinase, partial [Pseudomonadota bacterium]